MPVGPAMQTTHNVAEQRNLLRQVDWQTYLVLADQTDRAGCRMTYDRGMLEMMTPSMPHESFGSLLGRFIERFSEIRDIEIRSVASTTFRRSDLQRGFEADESYYIQNAARMVGVVQVDLALHPPPDLVVEIEISHSAIDKMKLFAAIGVPECWRYNQKTLAIFQLKAGTYVPCQESRVLNQFPIALAKELLELQLTSNETALVRRFAQHVEAL